MTTEHDDRMSVLMLVENNPYPQDPRVRNEAMTLTRAGHRVTVIAPRRTGQARSEVVDGVRVRRFAAPPEVSGAAGYAIEYAYATVAVGVLAVDEYIRHRFDVVHAHNPPDTLALIAGLFRPLGCRFVYDVHDLSPEMYLARFRKSDGGLVVRALQIFERISFALADHVITTNASYSDVARRRGRVPPERMTIVRNGPDLERVRRVAPDPALRARAEHLIGYVGVMGPQDGVDYLLRALGHLRDEFGRRDFLCVIVGRGDALADLRTLAHDLDLDEHVWFTGYVPDDELMRILSTVDVFVAPEPSNSFNDKSTMIKLTEYLVFGKPIVAFDLPEHRVTAGDAAHYATANDERDFARRLEQLFDDATAYQRAVEAAATRLPSLAWPAQEAALLSAYAALQSNNANDRAQPR